MWPSRPLREERVGARAAGREHELAAMHVARLPHEVAEVGPRGLVREVRAQPRDQVDHLVLVEGAGIPGHDGARLRGAGPEAVLDHVDEVAWALAVQSQAERERHT